MKPTLELKIGKTVIWAAACIMLFVFCLNLLNQPDDFTVIVGAGGILTLFLGNMYYIRQRFFYTPTVKKEEEKD